MTDDAPGAVIPDADIQKLLPLYLYLDLDAGSFLLCQNSPDFSRKAPVRRNLDLISVHFLKRLPILLPGDFQTAFFTAFHRSEARFLQITSDRHFLRSILCTLL